VRGYNRSKEKPSRESLGVIPRYHSYQRCNLFHQGWLFDECMNHDVSARGSFPLIGVMETDGGGGIIPDPGDNDPLGTTNSASFLCEGEVLTPADQHIHKVDSWAGGTKEDYITLLRRSGMSAEDATAFALAEECTSTDFYLGGDMARVQVASSVSSSYQDEGFSSALVLCVDLQDATRVLVTLLVVALLPSAEVAHRRMDDCLEEQQDNWVIDGQGRKGVRWSALSSALDRLLCLPGASCDRQYKHPLVTFNHLLKLT
jgi:hypothetical protein